MDATVLKVVKIVVGAIVGGFAGYLYYRFVGCSSGACPITSNPYMTIIYGILLSLVITV